MYMWDKADTKGLHVETSNFVREFRYKTFEGVDDMCGDFIDNILEIQ